MKVFKRRKYLILIGLFIYVILMIGGTYAYLYTADKKSTLAGNLSTANIKLQVTRVTPISSKGKSNLVPLLDTALKNALLGSDGKSSCIDANNNVSCEVYKVTIKNTGNSNLKLSSFITLVASGKNNIYQNLKWELIENATTRKKEYTTNGMEKSVLERNFSLAVSETKEYYFALWISENGKDQRETDKGIYGGLIEVNSSNGLGTTATFGDFDSDYCTNNGITKLSDCLLITDKYANSTEEAKADIETKVANFNETAPNITYTKTSSSNIQGSNIVSTTDKIYFGTNYTFNESTGQYALQKTVRDDMTNKLSTDTTKYYTCASNGTSCSTMYVIYSATSTTSNGTTTYRATKVDQYSSTKNIVNLSNSGLYMAEDDYGKSYYYRGSIDNNYVSFAGFIWRIIRINGDGSIRMIYSGTSTTDTGEKTSIGTSAFNTDPYDMAYLGYKYGLDKTYQETTATNLNYSNINANANYYFADSYTKNDATKKLSLSGNITSGTLENVWGSNNSTYKYSCFSTSQTGTCTTLVEIASYVNASQVKVKAYHSYLSKSYESTYTDEHDSTIKTKIDTWYKTNIQDKNYANYLSDNLFCNDRSIASGDGFSLNATTYYGAYQRNVNKKEPSYKCPRKIDQFTVSSTTTIGNGELTYPVGLLTADEVAYAGGKVGYDNREYYLATGQYYWLGSPSYFASGTAVADGWLVKSSGYLSPWNWLWSSTGVRPVINLKADTLIKGGNGTATSPYIVTY